MVLSLSILNYINVLLLTWNIIITYQQQLDFLIILVRNRLIYLYFYFAVKSVDILI